MKRFFTILTAALCLTLVSCGVGRTPKSTIKGFFKAIEAGEYVEALALTSLGEEGDTAITAMAITLMRAISSCFFSLMFLASFPLMKSSVSVELEVRTREERVDMEAERTRITTMAIRKVERPESMVGMTAS